MSFQPHPHPQGATDLASIPETPSTFVAPPPGSHSFSPLKQLRAPPIPFVPQSAPEMSSSSSSTDVTLDFYILDPQAPAIFSTNNGARPKRELVKPFPSPIIRTDMASDVEVRATQLIEAFPEVKSLKGVPTNWYILHRFFDGHDLWVEGAKFCYWVILAISRKNEERDHVATAQWQEIDLFAYHWLMAHRDVVFHNSTVNPMIALFTEAEQRQELEGMTVNEVQLLNERLAFHRHQWLVAVAAESGRQSAEPHQQPLPQHGQQMHLVGPLGPVNQPGRTPMAAGIMPQTHRIRRDSNSSTAPHPANDQQLVRRGSMPGQSGKIQGHILLNTRRQVTSNGYQNQGHPKGSYNDNGAVRPRGLPSTTQNSRSRDFSQNSFQGNSWRYASDSQGGNSSGNTPSREPVYIRHIPPPYDGPHSVGNRVVSAPTPGNPLYPENRIISGGRSQIKSPTNRKQNFHSSQAMVISPINRGEMSGPRRYASGSSALHLSSSPTNRVTWSNDAQVSTPSERKFPWIEDHFNNSLTIHYHEGARDDDSVRTLHIEGYEPSMLFSHQLKGMLEECGKVISIHYLPLSNHRAFVTYVEPPSVGHAILRFNRKVLPSGHRLQAGLPNNKVRSRSNSNASQNYRNVQHNPPREFESRSRRPSIRNASNNYLTNTHSRRPSINRSLTSPSGFMDNQLQAAIAEVVQHQSALERQMPLSSIENAHNATKKMKSSPGTLQQSVTHIRSSGKKENLSPRKKAGQDDNGENSSPRTSGKNHSKHRKGSKQNTSTRPTPAVTPIKSMSTVDLKDTENLQITTDLSTLSIGKGGRLPRRGIKKNNAKQKNIHDSSKSDVSINTDAPSDTTLSPLESMPMTRDTSFSFESSRKQTQINCPQITKSQSASDISSLISGAATTKSKSKKSLKPRSKKQLGSATDEQINVAVESTIVASKDCGTQGKNGEEVTVSHSKKGIKDSVASNKSLRKADAAPVQPCTDQSPVIVPTPEGNLDGTIEAAASSAVPAAPSVAMTETQSPKGNEKSWTSLASSPTADSDAKRLPPPVMGPLTSVPAGNKKSVKPAVPAVAVPRAFETQPRPPRGLALGLDIGTEAWPFVRKSRGK